MSISILNNARIPCGMLINAAGHYQKTQLRAVAEAVINLTVSLLLVGKYGIYGVLIGTVISFLYRTMDIIIYGNYYILKQSPVKSLRRVFRMIIIIMIVWCAEQYFYNIEIVTWIEWVLYGIIIFLVTAVLAIVMWLVFDYKSFKGAIIFAKKYLILKQAV